MTKSEFSQVKSLADFLAKSTADYTGASVVIPEGITIEFDNAQPELSVAVNNTLQDTDKRKYTPFIAYTGKGSDGVPYKVSFGILFGRSRYAEEKTSKVFTRRADQSPAVVGTTEDGKVAIISGTYSTSLIKGYKLELGTDNKMKPAANESDIIIFAKQ